LSSTKVNIDQVLENAFLMLLAWIENFFLYRLAHFFIYREKRVLKFNS